ncbi:MAG: hypothetical protein EOM20_08540 [Spartobacteria bacterium]|nr:hypothetical protein [Spartobacteria bacterium]
MARGNVGRVTCSGARRRGKSLDEVSSAIPGGAAAGNKRMYILSLVAALFMPLGFLTGLLGINVAGIPGAENPYAFMLFIVFLAVVVTGQLVLFKRKRWF